MISARELCRHRRIQKVDLPTPMLIPSFSSKGFPDVNRILSLMKNHITDVAMISSYDMFYSSLDSDLATPSLLFIDSGGYEARQGYDISEVYAVEHQPREWTRAHHKKVLDELDTLSALVFVSFDEIENNVPISDQLEQAGVLFDSFPEAASDFLIKPYDSVLINIDEALANPNEFSGFDLIGFTEKELGASLVERLRSIVRVRQIFIEAGIDVPIHVFGCLDPLSVQLFYLCGADVFDGLSWLRFAFHNSVAMYRNNWAIIADYPHLSYTEIRQWSWIENLAVLTRLRDSMIRYATCFDTSIFEANTEIIERLLNVVGVTAM
jgi:hypothetical protein